MTKANKALKVVQCLYNPVYLVKEINKTIAIGIVTKVIVKSFMEKED